MAGKVRDLTVAFRMLRKTPFVTAIAVASLALGIGANTAIYSLFDQILLRGLPVPEPARLVNLDAPGPKPGSQSCGQAGDCEAVFSYPMYKDLAATQTVFTGIAGHVSFGANVSVQNEASSTQGMLVSGSYFGVLQLRPAVGRLIQESDDQVVGANFVTVLSHEFWRERYGSDRHVVGQTVLVNAKPLTIIGVAPEGFRGTTLGAEPALYVPLTMRSALSTWPVQYENRRSYWVYLFARLKPGVAAEAAAAQLNTLYKPILNDIEAPLQEGMSDARLKEFKARSITVTAGSRGQSSVHREARAPLLMLFGVTATVLLIACANIANLLLARGASRATEMGVRLALGASRGQLLRQLITESLVLATVGGLVSLLVASWTLQGIGALMPADALEELSFSLQPRILVFSAVLTISTGLLFGLFPALHSTRSDLITAMRAGAGQIAGGRAASRFRTVLATAQIALSMTLLISAGLFLRSLVNVSRADLGVSVNNVATFAVSPGQSGYDRTRTIVLYERVEQELANMPGVTGVTAGLVRLMSGNNWGNDVRVQGFAHGPDVDANARFNAIGTDYFNTLGMQLLSGREFTAADRRGSGDVVVINEAFAKKFNLGANPVGKFMSQGSDSLTMQIVGLVKDARYAEVKDAVPPVFFIPWRQNDYLAGMNFYVRGTQDPEQLFAGIAAVMKGIDPTIPVEQLKTMPQQIRENIFLDRLISIMASAFAVLATVLAGIGLYGVLAYSVAQRTREIGVRMALGANASRVRTLIMRQVLAMTAVGAVIGIVTAFGVGRAAQSQLYNLQGHDPIVFVLSVVLLTLVALSAGYLPALRASKVDPMQALRYD